MTWIKPRPQRADRSAEFAGYVPRPRAAAVAVTDTRARLVVPMPKPARAKPGKRTPTAAEREWMDAITTLGCIACIIDGHPYTPGAVHHILRAGRRIGHMHSICLCDPGHHQNGEQFGKVSRHPHKARFERRYGSEPNLLAFTQELVGTRTMNALYGDGSEHAACGACGRCADCGDCICSPETT
jgi:hypothetical protein